MSEKFYKLTEVGKMLSVSKSSLLRWIKDGKLKAVKFGADTEGTPWRVSETSLNAFVAKHGYALAPPPAKAKEGEPASLPPAPPALPPRIPITRMEPTTFDVSRFSKKAKP